MICSNCSSFDPNNVGQVMPVTSHMTFQALQVCSDVEQNIKRTITNYDYYYICEMLEFTQSNFGFIVGFR